MTCTGSKFNTAYDKIEHFYCVHAQYAFQTAKNCVIHQNQILYQGLGYGVTIVALEVWT